MLKIHKAKKYNNNKEIVKFYNEFGFICIKNYIAKKSLMSIKVDINRESKRRFDKNFDEVIPYLNKVNKKKLYLFNRLISSLHSLKALNLELAKFNKVLFPKKNIFCIADSILLSLPKNKRLTYDFHQDTHYVRNFKDILNIHYPIFFKSEYNNGSMSVLSKSHKEGPLKYIIKRKSKNSRTNLIPIGINKIKEKYEEILLELEVGDVAFFHKDLIHKSNFNFTNRTRTVGLGRYTSSMGNFDIIKSEDL